MVINFNIKADNQEQNEALLAKEQEIEALKNQLFDHETIKQQSIENFNKLVVSIFFKSI